MKVVRELSLNMNVSEVLKVLNTLLRAEGIDAGKEKIYFSGRFDGTGGSIQNRNKLYSSVPFEIRISKQSEQQTRLQIAYAVAASPKGYAGLFLTYGVPLAGVLLTWMLTDQLTTAGFLKTLLIAILVLFLTRRWIARNPESDNSEIDYLMEYLRQHTA